MGCDNLYYKFYEELQYKHNITKEQFIQYNFICCGIYKPPTETYINDDGNECKRYIKHLIPKEGERLFPTTNFEIHPTKFIDEKLFKLLSHRFTYTYNCICDKSIIKNCFIYSISQDILLNIGKCCNKRFNENDTKRFCEICSVHHRNIKNNFCNECRKKMYDKCKKLFSATIGPGKKICGWGLSSMTAASAELAEKNIGESRTQFNSFSTVSIFLQDGLALRW